jgi:hypothetical protein
MQMKRQTVLGTSSQQAVRQTWPTASVKPPDILRGKVTCFDLNFKFISVPGGLGESKVPGAAGEGSRTRKDGERLEINHGTDDSGRDMVQSSVLEVLSGCSERMP